MSQIPGTSERQMHYEEIKARSASGIAILILNIVLMIGAIIGFIYGVVPVDKGAVSGFPWTGLAVVCAVYFSLIGPFLFVGLKILQPNEALVLTLFGKYYGTLRGEGFFFVNPFVAAVNPASVHAAQGAAVSIEKTSPGGKSSLQGVSVKVP
ncbi:MAG: hypothetical protein PHY77_08745, partial [Desulfotomaculaceae bacterium]|nr:hypothetical protein [Desulfotomaculaceae bacterium]